jgi:hypothetical protein
MVERWRHFPRPTNLPALSGLLLPRPSGSQLHSLPHRDHFDISEALAHESGAYL